MKVLKIIVFIVGLVAIALSALGQGDPVFIGGPSNKDFPAIRLQYANSGGTISETCNSANRGLMAYVDDTDDTTEASMYFCGVDVDDTTPIWIKIGVVPPFVPTDIPGLLVWYDPTTMPYGDGDDVDLWADSSGNANDLTPVSSYKPHYRGGGTGYFGTSPYVDFDNVSFVEYLKCDSAVTTIRSAYWTVRADASQNAAPVILGNNPTYPWLTDNATKFVTAAYATHDCYHGAGYQDGTALADALAITYDSANSHILGVETLSAVCAFDRLCSDRAYGATGYSGGISEFLAYDTVLSSTDRQKVEGYLACQSGLQASLPGGHPYKVTCP